MLSHVKYMFKLEKLTFSPVKEQNLLQHSYVSYASTVNKMKQTISEVAKLDGKFFALVKFCSLCFFPNVTRTWSLAFCLPRELFILPALKCGKEPNKKQLTKIQETHKTAFQDLNI